MKRKHLLLFFCTAIMSLMMVQISWAQSTDPNKLEINLTEPGTLSDHVTEAQYSTVTEMVLSGSINQLDLRALRNMTALAKLNMEEANIVEYTSSTTATVFPADCIHDYIFEDRANLKEVVFPKTLKQIGQSAFKNSGLTQVILPEGVESIGAYAFAFVKSNTKVSLPSTLKEVGNFSFLANTELVEVVIPEGVAVIGGAMFSGCAKLPSITLPTSITQIGFDAFKGCVLFTSIVIPEKCTSIGSAAFKNVSQLAQITSKAVTPPNIDLKVFDEAIYNTSKLHIPAESFDSYLDHYAWQLFFGRIYDLEGNPLAIDQAIGTSQAQVVLLPQGIELQNTGGQDVEVYNLMGQTEYSYPNAPEHLTLPLQAGKYLVRIGKAIHKVSL